MSTAKSPSDNSRGALPGTPVLLAFLVAIFFGGSNAVAVRFTVAELDPFWGAAIRFAAAALIFNVIIFIRRVSLPRGRTLAGVVIYGILNFGLSFALIYFAIREVTAGFTMIILALTPLLTFLLAVIHRLEPFRWRALAGSLLAVVGIAVPFAGQLGGGVPLWAVLFMIAAAACFAEATVIIKILPPVSPLAANGIGMMAATLLLASLSLVTGETWVLPELNATRAAVVYLVTFGSVGLFYLVVNIIQQWTATASSYILVLSPFVTVPLGAVLAGEEVTVELLLGAFLVLAGVFFGALTTPPQDRADLQAPTAGQ